MLINQKSRPFSKPGFLILYRQHYFLSAAASSCLNCLVITTDAIGIRGEFIISMFSTFTSSTLMLPLISKSLIDTSISSFKSLGSVFTFKDLIFGINLESCSRSLEIDLLRAAINYTRHQFLRAELSGGSFAKCGPQLSFDCN